MSTSPRAAAALLIVGALLAGIVLGVAGDRAWMHYHRSQRAPGFERLVEHLDQELHFTPQQKESVKQIIERHRARIHAISDGVRPQMRQEIESTNAEIEKLLTPEQRTKFQSLQQRHNNRRRMRGMDRSLPPPPDALPH